MCRTNGTIAYVVFELYVIPRGETQKDITLSRFRLENRRVAVAMIASVSSIAVLFYALLVLCIEWQRVRKAARWRIGLHYCWFVTFLAADSINES